MKLLRASCPCGFHTRKARGGYHFHQWWFPLFSTRTGQLTDVSRSLPDPEVEQIQLSKVQAHKLHRPFIESVTRELVNQFASQSDCVFDPPPQSTFRCPQCGNDTLTLNHVHVIAICKADCGHEYQWPDSEEHRCPECDCRPHAFRTESEEQFASQPRTICSCRCSSATDCTSHVDGYCPKCGRLPSAYHADNKQFCGMHHEVMLPYNVPGNFIFMHPHAPTEKFQNAKRWGDAIDTSDGLSGSYCLLCETDRKRWLERHCENDG